MVGIWTNLKQMGLGQLHQHKMVHNLWRSQASPCSSHLCVKETSLRSQDLHLYVKDLPLEDVCSRVGSEYDVCFRVSSIMPNHVILYPFWSACVHHSCLSTWWQNNWGFCGKGLRVIIRTPCSQIFPDFGIPWFWLTSKWWLYSPSDQLS